MLADCVPHMARMGNAGAEYQPGSALGTMLDNFGHGGARHLIAINCGLKVLGDELTAARANTTDIKLGRGLLGDHRAEVALLDHVQHRNLICDIGKKPILALVQQAAIQPVRCGGETDDLGEAGVDLL